MPRSNPKAISIYTTDPTIGNSDSFKRFIEKGHIQAEVYDIADVIIGPSCWRIDPALKLGDDSSVEESLERQLEMMEKGIRAIKYPKQKEDNAQHTSNPQS